VTIPTLTPYERLQVLAFLGMLMSLLLGLLIGRASKRTPYNVRDERGRFVRAR